jgi:hypothetical protein
MLTAAHGSAEERRTNVSQGEIQEEVRGAALALYLLVSVLSLVDVVKLAKKTWEWWH